MSAPPVNGPRSCSSERFTSSLGRKCHRYQGIGFVKAELKRVKLASTFMRYHQRIFCLLAGLSRVAPREIFTLSSLDKMKILSGDEGVFYLTAQHFSRSAKS
jgi:hypothetical protein